MRVRLRGARRPGRAGPDVPLRRAQAAAVLLAAVGRRPAVAGAGAQAAAGRHRGPAGQRRHRRRDAARPGQRDRMVARPLWPARATTWPRWPSTSGTPRCRPRRSPRCSRSTSRSSSEAEQLDFDDLLLHTCAVLEDDEAVAREFRSRYRCFVVDEYQDVTPLQQRTLDAWLGGRDQLTVVGDANQTIYSFAGASPGYLLGFDRRYPNADGRPAGTRLPVDAAGGLAGQPDHRRQPAGHGRAVPAAADGGAARRPGGDVHRASGRARPRRRAVAGGRRRADRGRAAGVRASPCCTGSTPSPRSTRRR